MMKKLGNNMKMKIFIMSNYMKLMKTQMKMMKITKMIKELELDQD